MSINNELRAQIEKTIASNRVVLFMKGTPQQPQCGFSATVIGTLPKDAMLVFHCHLGARSQSATDHFRLQGFTNVHNLIGGIDAWSQEVDTSVPRY